MKPPEFTAACDLFSDQFCMSRDVLLSPGRAQHIAEARFALFWFCFRKLNMTPLEIGLLTNRSRHTVYWGINRAADLIFVNKFYARKIAAVERAFSALDSEAA